jgi:chromosomal replication initiation ATPase DnaA
MPRTIIDPSALKEANLIIDLVCKLMNVPVKEVTTVGRKREATYVRRLIVYTIRSRTMLQWKPISRMVGFAEERGMNATVSYSVIRKAYKVDQEVKADIDHINNLLNKRYDNAKARRTV